MQEKTVTEAEEPTIADVLESVLPEIDKYLSEQQVMLGMRPTHAAVEFCREFVLELQVDGRVWEPDLENLDFMTEPWFRGIYQLTEQWYQKRFGDALHTNTQRSATAFVLSFGIPFRVDVPLSIISPGSKPKTVWLQFPDSVLPHEEPVAWIKSPPNLPEMDFKEKKRLTKDLRTVCELLRSISSNKMGIIRLTAESRGFVSAAKGHLETAACQVLDHWQEKGTAKAAWELQIACESALKAVAETRNGSYKPKHDLFILYDDVASHLSGLSRNEFRKLPRWEQMADYRYAQGAPPSLKDAFKYYLTTLRVVAACFEELSTIGLGQGSFLIGLPPWKQPNGGQVKAETPHEAEQQADQENQGKRRREGGDDG